MRRTLMVVSLTLLSVVVLLLLLNFLLGQLRQSQAQRYAPTAFPLAETTVDPREASNPGGTREAQAFESAQRERRCV